ncbi:MAG TPA: type I secretion system permease/ATPase [Pseudolabrys sp.]|nr:type I secretion system permease/ATPase [Pseudolabrys sp.]
MKQVITQTFFPEGRLHPDLAGALNDCRRSFWSVAAFSGAVNVLMLVGPLYMLQVYDRVLASRSIPTLIGLTILMIGAYLFQGLFDFIRSRIVVRVAALIDRDLETAVHSSIVKIALQSRRAGVALQPLRDLDQIRSFLNSGGPIAIVDMPWMPLYLAICFLIHPLLGVVALVGGIMLFSLAVFSERNSRETARILAQGSGLRSASVEADSRNCETLVAMGMIGVMAQRWSAINGRYLTALGRSTDLASGFGSLSKALRMMLQSTMLGTGAYLVIHQELSAGAMVAASIMLGRALAPIETAIANWRGFVSARQSLKRLSEVLSHFLPEARTLELPRPKASIQVSQLWVSPPMGQDAIVRGVSFHLAAGEVLGIIGPSGAGKTSLLRTLVGIWQPARGTIRIDGATLDQWDQRLLGPAIGYASQPAELFDGTIADNIARMATDYPSEHVLKAAQAAGAHEMILRLPQGYNTPVGESGLALSSGQRQRISLARALYDDPFLIVLDEPHANLDSDGEHALTDAILGAKARGAIVILIAHRPSELATCDKVLVLTNGTQHAFGARDEVLRHMAPQTVPVPLKRGPAAREKRLAEVRS